MTLKIYADRISQPARALLIFCKVNGIDFEEIEVSLFKGQHLSSQYEGINPMKLVPAITDGRFKLFESHAILIYIACAFPGVADHWYPADLSRRAKIHSLLDWHHSNLRRGAVTLVMNTVIAAKLGRPMKPQAAVEGEALLIASLSKIESFWLKGGGHFLLGGFQPSIADLLLACEIMQLEVLGEKHRNKILDPYKKVQLWVEHTRRATMPHFDQVHGVLFEFVEQQKHQSATDNNTEHASGRKVTLQSKM